MPIKSRFLNSFYNLNTTLRSGAYTKAWPLVSNLDHSYLLVLLNTTMRIYNRNLEVVGILNTENTVRLICYVKCTRKQI